MKTLVKIFTFFTLGLFVLLFAECSEEKIKTKQQEFTEFLVDKQGGWSLNSIVVPSNTATDEGDWAGFKLNVSASQMNTSGHPVGSMVVWPLGTWSMNESGTSITRNDGAVMNVITLNATQFKIRFTVPDDVHIGSRIAALGGEYTFDLK